MNIENILKVADAIEQHTIAGLGFNMGNFFSSHLPDQSGHNCGTTACIGGWANAVEGNIVEFKPDDWIVLYSSTRAAEFLGFDADEPAEEQIAGQLFYAWNHPAIRTENPNWFTDITPEQAVRTLRHLAATGTVDWTV